MIYYYIIIITNKDKVVTTDIMHSVLDLSLSSINWGDPTFAPASIAHAKISW